LIIDYIISLTNLYGLYTKEKLIEIYNFQNEIKIDITILNEIISENRLLLEKNFTYVEGNYFASESIAEFDEIELYISKKGDKPYYIPEKEELLKYKDNLYFEETEEYHELISFFKKNIIKDDDERMFMICEEIQSHCQFEFSLKEIFEYFTFENISFKNQKEVEKLIEIIAKLANNTRIWENNGFTPREIYEKHHLKPLPKTELNFKKKIGRNDPCPCGSGKKYKKCCLGKKNIQFPS